MLDPLSGSSGKAPDRKRYLCGYYQFVEFSSLARLALWDAKCGVSACAAQPALSDRARPSHALCDWRGPPARQTPLPRPLGKPAPRSQLCLCADRENLRAGNVVRRAGGYSLGAGDLLLHILFCPEVLGRAGGGAVGGLLRLPPLPPGVRPCCPAGILP